MEQFSLEKYLENPQHKVVTRQGNPVRIICTDRKTSNSTNVIGLAKNHYDVEQLLVCNTDGRDVYKETQDDLFFADEEEELTEFEKYVRNILGRYISNIDDFPETIKNEAKSLLDLARKELLKDLPKWNKAHEHKEFPLHLCVMDKNMYPFLDTEVNEGDYYIELSDLKTLPKEE